MDVATEDERWAIVHKIAEQKDRCGLIFGVTGRMQWKRLTCGDHALETRYVQTQTATHMVRDGRCTLPRSCIGLTHLFIMDGALSCDEDFLRAG